MVGIGHNPAGTAEAAHCTRYHLARVFKRSMGVPPHSYLIQVRVRSAHALLSMGTGQESLAELAAASGFSDQSHLTRRFKRVLGITPRQVRTARPTPQPALQML